jgi:alkylation response protein AidB-like acyl-CoA dehydrogenase
MLNGLAQSTTNLARARYDTVACGRAARRPARDHAWAYTQTRRAGHDTTRLAWPGQPRRPILVHQARPDCQLK